MPTVSVIVPNYNHAKYLGQRIESILKQKNAMLHEIILLDDASVDSSLDVLSVYLAKPNVRLVRNEVNSGSTFKQWQKGLAMATGEYVWIAESDDYSDTLFLEFLVEALQKHPNAGLAFCSSVVVDSEGNEISDRIVPFSGEKQWENSFVASGREFIVSHMMKENSIPNASSVLFRKSVLDTLNEEYVQFRLSGDWYFYLQVLLRSDVCFVARPLNFFRFHPHTVRQGTHRSCLILKEHLIIFKMLFASIDLNVREKYNAAKAFVARFATYAFSMSSEERKEIWHMAFKTQIWLPAFYPYWLLIRVFNKR